MTEITIKNKQYKLGPIKANRASVTKITNISKAISGQGGDDWLIDAYDLLEEAIKAGNSETDANEALDNIELSKDPESGFYMLVGEIIKSVM